MVQLENVIAAGRRPAGIPAHDARILFRPLDFARLEIALEAADRRDLLRERQVFFAFDELGGEFVLFRLALLHRGNVGTDADNAAIRGAPLDDLAPAAVLIGTDDRAVAGTVGFMRSSIQTSKLSP